MNVDRDLTEDLRLTRVKVEPPTTLDVVSREISCVPSGLRVLGGYEIVAGPQDQQADSLDIDAEGTSDEPLDPEDAEFERVERENWRYHPGLTTRVAYLALNDDWYTRMRIKAGARASRHLDTWWLQSCERVWTRAP